MAETLVLNTPIGQYGVQASKTPVNNGSGGSKYYIHEIKCSIMINDHHTVVQVIKKCITTSSTPFSCESFVNWLNNQLIENNKTHTIKFDNEVVIIDNHYGSHNIIIEYPIGSLVEISDGDYHKVWNMTETLSSLFTYVSDSEHNYINTTPGQIFSDRYSDTVTEMTDSLY